MDRWVSVFLRLLMRRSDTDESSALSGVFFRVNTINLEHYLQEFANNKVYETS